MQWTKNLTAVAWATVEVWIQSLAWHMGLRAFRVATAVIQIQSPAWELLYAIGEAMKQKKNQKTKKGNYVKETLPKKANKQVGFPCGTVE